MEPVHLTIEHLHLHLVFPEPLDFGIRGESESDTMSIHSFTDPEDALDSFEDSEGSDVDMNEGLVDWAREIWDEDKTMGGHFYDGLAVYRSDLLQSTEMIDRIVVMKWEDGRWYALRVEKTPKKRGGKFLMLCASEIAGDGSVKYNSVLTPLRESLYSTEIDAPAGSWFVRTKLGLMEME